MMNTNSTKFIDPHICQWMFGTRRVRDEESLRVSIEQSGTCGTNKKCNHGKAHPSLWGPKAWYFLHTSAAFYPMNPTKAQQQAMKESIKTLPVLLPCKKCTHECEIFVNNYIDDLDDICSTNDKLFRFFVDLHNAVNQRTGKPTMSYEEARKIYYD